MKLNTIKQVERLAREDAGVISLAQGIPSFPVDAKIRTQIVRAIASGKTDAYSDPQGLPLLRRKIAQQATRDGMPYGDDEIIVTAGAIEALNVALKSVVGDERDEVIVPTPVYAAYFQLIAAASAKAVAVRLDEARGWALDVAQLEVAVTARTAAIMLCHPNNPTGSLYDKATLEAICDMALARGITVIIDEVYRNMLYTDDAFYTPAMTKKYKPCLIRVMSFSKDFSLTGWRVGYLQADHSRIDSLVALHDSLINCAPVVAQYAAIAALDNFDRIIAENRVAYEANRQAMATALVELHDYLDFSEPAGGYFFFPKIKHVDDSEQTVHELALKAGVVVVPGEAFGPGGEGHFRLCFGRSGHSIEQGMQRMKNYFTRSL